MRKTFAGLLYFLAACQPMSSPPSPEQPTPQENEKPSRKPQPPAEVRKLDPAVLALIEKHGPDVPALVQGNSDFGLALYQRLADNDGNLFFSPYSISNALAMTYAGARGNTAVQMKDVLRFPLDDDRLHPAFANLIAQLHGNGEARPFQLTVANRLWGQRDYGFLPPFLKIGRDFYDGGLQEVNFIDDHEGARQIINRWVEDRTKDKVKELIPSGFLSDRSRLVLTNAIYFKAGWMNAFEPSRTKPAPFHLLGGTTMQTPMMHNNLDARFADHATFSMVELPYESHELAMIILLPKKKDGLRDLEKTLTVKNLATWMTQLGPHTVDLKLPRFKMTSKFELSDRLKEMGMRDAFDQRPDFSGMAGPDELDAAGLKKQLYISAVLHKAFVEVDEKGTEAAAATAVIMNAVESVPKPSPPATFHADHPFVFLIRDQRSGSILFMGRVVNPGP